MSRKIVFGSIPLDVQKRSPNSSPASPPQAISHIGTPENPSRNRTQKPAHATSSPSSNSVPINHATPVSPGDGTISPQVFHSRTANPQHSAAAAALIPRSAAAEINPKPQEPQPSVTSEKADLPAPKSWASLVSRGGRQGRPSSSGSAATRSNEQSLQHALQQQEVPQPLAVSQPLAVPQPQAVSPPPHVPQARPGLLQQASPQSHANAGPPPHTLHAPPRLQQQQQPVGQVRPPPLQQTAAAACPPAPGSHVAAYGMHVAQAGAQVAPHGVHGAHAGAQVAPHRVHVVHAGAQVAPHGVHGAHAGAQVAPHRVHVAHAGAQVAPQGVHVAHAGAQVAHHAPPHVSPAGDEQQRAQGRAQQAAPPQMAVPSKPKSWAAVVTKDRQRQQAVVQAHLVTQAPTQVVGLQHAVEVRQMPKHMATTEPAAEGGMQAQTQAHGQSSEVGAQAGKLIDAAAVTVAFPSAVPESGADSAHQGSYAQAEGLGFKEGQPVKTAVSRDSAGVNTMPLVVQGVLAVKIEDQGYRIQQHGSTTTAAATHYSTFPAGNPHIVGNQQFPAHSVASSVSVAVPSTGSVPAVTNTLPASQGGAAAGGAPVVAAAASGSTAVAATSSDDSAAQSSSAAGSSQVLKPAPRPAWGGAGAARLFASAAKAGMQTPVQGRGQSGQAPVPAHGQTTGQSGTHPVAHAGTAIEAAVQAGKQAAVQGVEQAGKLRGVQTAGYAAAALPPIHTASAGAGSSSFSVMHLPLAAAPSSTPLAAAAAVPAGGAPAAGVLAASAGAAAPPPPAAGAAGGSGAATATTPAARFVPRGLSNPGNMCFLNATMQALVGCMPFATLLRDVSKQAEQQQQQQLAAYPTLHALAAFWKAFEIQAAASDTVTPSTGTRGGGQAGRVRVGEALAPAVMFDAVLTAFNPQNHRNGVHSRQEDAQEFLSFLVDRMHEELLRLAPSLPPSALSSSSSSPSPATTAPFSLTLYDSHGSQGGRLDGPMLNGGEVGTQEEEEEEEEEDEWETVGPKNRAAVTRTYAAQASVLSGIFGGMLRSEVRSKGSKPSATLQPFSLLHLDIAHERVRSVDDALRLLTEAEAIEGYRGTRNAAVSSAVKVVKIAHLPQVLILHLMRFSFNAAGSVKIHKPVHFPLSLTVTGDIMHNRVPLEERQYKLFATVVHHGRDSSSGHYTADVHQPDGSWLRFDDAKVFSIAPARVLQERAYLLMYQKERREA